MFHYSIIMKADESAHKMPVMLEEGGSFDPCADEVQVGIFFSVWMGDFLGMPPHVCHDTRKEKAI